ncbi:hypothetical protein GCM10009122_06290 [Fulvivirga kasyanovii]
MIFKIKNDIRPENAEYYDILCVEKIEHSHGISSVSFVIIEELALSSKVVLRFDWKEKYQIDPTDFLWIEETNILFFKSTNQWAAFDLLFKKLVRHESSNWSPLIARRPNYVLIEDDIMAEAVDLNGRMIDSVPIDPPTEAVIFDDRIEYNSPVFGRQTLKLKTFNSDLNCSQSTERI